MVETIGDALKRYFADNNFGADGGYGAEWVDFKLGPIPFPLPNTAARKEAVKFHDVNHLLTGYQTDTISEFEISAWELGAGCRSYLAAWVINLGGLAAGLFVAPRRTWRAFVAGRKSEAAYSLTWDELVDADVDTVRKLLHVQTRGEPTVGDASRFALAAMGGVAVGSMMLGALLSPVTLLLWLKARRARAAQ